MALGCASPARLLVVDDHADIREPMALFLERQGFTVWTSADTRQARACLQAQAIDLVVLDVMLPGEDGLSLCSELAHTGRVPVILLTALASMAERIAGLEGGADDYLVKPFDPHELVARIRTVMRRVRRAEPAAALPVFRFEGWTLDTQRRQLLDREGQPVALSEAEYRLLTVFATHPQQVLSREQLLDLTHADEVGVFDRSIDTQISRLRRKIEASPRRPELLKTAWGSGYIFVPEVTPRMR